MVQRAWYRAQDFSVLLSLPSGSLRREAQVTVQWNILDAQGRAVTGQYGPFRAG